MHYPALPYVSVFCCLTWVLQINFHLKNMQRRSQCFCLVSEAETWKGKDADLYMNDQQESKYFLYEIQSVHIKLSKGIPK